MSASGPTLSTHMLDLVSGCPAVGVGIELWRDGELVFAGFSNADGRCPALAALKLSAGSYRLSFAVAAYFKARGVALADPPFLDIVPIDFAMGETGHYHVPLLASPFGYSTYRGS